MANVAALTFLAARAVPLGWVVAVAGGVPLARAGQRHGGRAGYATAIASLVETMAIMGLDRPGWGSPHLRRRALRWSESWRVAVGL